MMTFIILISEEGKKTSWKEEEIKKRREAEENPIAL